MQARSKGWLTPEFHLRWRELHLHALARETLCCPVYCLMPDHAHLLWVGSQPGSDQRRAMRLLRRWWGQALGAAWKLQKQGFDHVLRPKERDIAAFESVATYILENPVRAGLVQDWKRWPYSGCLVPGHADLKVRAPDYWPRFWRTWTAQVSEHALHP